MSPRRPRRSILQPVFPLALCLLVGAAGALCGVHRPLAGQAAGAEPAREGASAVAGPILEGTVRAEGLRADGVLPGALLEFRQGDRLTTVISGEDGRYRIGDLEPGPVRIHVFHLATRPLRLDVRLPARGRVSLDLELEPRALALAPLEVTTRPVPRPRPVRPTDVTRAAGQTRVALQGLEATPGMAESGLVGALAVVPGEDEPAPDQVLFMRGSTVDARTVLLDGAPILTPFHVAGLVSPFESEWVDDARLYLGGAPSRYAGGISYLLDVDTRSPRGEGGLSGRVAADGLLFRGSVEAPFPGGGGVLLAGRTLHGLQSRVEQGETFPYAFGDLLARAHLPLGGGHHVRVTGFTNREGIRLDPVLLGEGLARWGNRAASATYTGQVGRAVVTALGARSRYEAALPLEWEDPVMGRAAADRRRMSLEARMPFDGFELHTGAAVDRMDFEYRLDPRARIAELQTVVVGEPVRVARTAVGGFAEVAARLSERVDGRVGLRAEHFSGDDGLYLAPRGSLRLFLTDDAALSLAAGRYHQPVPQPELAASTVGESARVLSWNPRLPVASSTHLVLSLDQLLDDHLHLGVSGFVKSFYGMEPGSGERVNASGTDLRVTRSGDRLGAWIGYALSWFWEGQPGTGSSTFSGRHLVSAGLQGSLVDRFEVGMTVGYGAGLPLSPVALTDQPVSGLEAQRLNQGVHTLSSGSGGISPLELTGTDEFLRLDLEVALPLEPRVAGRTTRLRPYLRVLNALDSRDALFHYFDRWRDGELRPVAERPFLPLVGVEWSF